MSVDRSLLGICFHELADWEVFVNDVGIEKV